VREAVAKRKLEDLVQLIKSLESDIDEVKGLSKVVSSKRLDLKDIQVRIRDQIKLCEEELGLHGRKWGERGPSSVSNDGFSDLFSERSKDLGGVSSLDDLLIESEQNLINPAESSFHPSSTPEEVDGFLNASAKEDAEKEEQVAKDPTDYSDLFT